MDLETTFKEVCDGLKLTRNTDRKKNAENLKEYLTRNAVPCMLTHNALRKTGYCWSNVFDDINEYFLKECEKFETSKTFDTITVPLCTSLLHLCVAGSNKGRAYVRCEKILEACYTILKDPRLATAVGDAYLTLLYKYVLPLDHYLGFIKPSDWEDLLNIGTATCLKSYSKLDDFTKLRFILIVLKNGSEYCQFAVSLKESLSQIKRCFLRLGHDKKLQSAIVDITIVIIKTLSMECRLTMCQFTESILSSILKFYDPNQDVSKKSSLFQLLNYTMMVHHPHGRKQNQECSLASDWILWNKHLHNILEIICLEVTYLQKNPKHSTIKQFEYFFSLAAAVYFQIFEGIQSLEDEPGPSNKRQKISFNKIKTFRDLLDELRINSVPWLGIIQVFVKKYGDEIAPLDYLTLINVLESIITNDKANVNWDIYKELACDVLKKLTDATSGQDDSSAASLLLWNSCVRNSSNSSSHKAMHRIIQSLLDLNILSFNNIQTLVKFYTEKSMPVTNSSVATVNSISKRFFTKFNSLETKISLYSWFVNGDNHSVDISKTEEFVSRLLAHENVNVYRKKIVSEDGHFDLLFNSIEDCILFSEFDIDAPEIVEYGELNIDRFEIQRGVLSHMTNDFITTLREHIERLKRKEIDILRYIEYTTIVVVAMECMIKNSTNKCDFKQELRESIELAATQMFKRSQDVLASNTQIPVKIKLLQRLEDIMAADLSPALGSLIRNCINEDFFRCISDILHVDNKDENDDIVCAEDDDLDIDALRHHCVYVLASFCRIPGPYRDELLELILDPKCYTYSKDTQCVLRCIEILSDGRVEQPPIGLMFQLIANICKEMYRNPKASLGILKTLYNMIESIWSENEVMKQNCCIMIKSYLQRCEKSYYPPAVAAAVYKCAAKIVSLNNRRYFSDETMFEESITNQIRGDIHSVRLYCCHLLQYVFTNFSNDHVSSYLAGLLNMFLINVLHKKEILLKDEATNRTHTILRAYISLVEINKSLVHQVIMEVLRFQKEKTLNMHLTQKILKRICHISNVKEISVYLDDNVLSVLHFWFTNNLTIETLPLNLFKCDDINVFVERYKNWLIPADALWNSGGNIKESSLLHLIKQNNKKQSLEEIIEDSFPHIVALSLPYVVIDKYKLHCLSELPASFKESLESGQKMFHQTGQMLTRDKWTNLFVENVGEILMLTAVHLCDHSDANRLFGIDIQNKNRSFYYSKRVYLSVLDFIGELSDCSIMQYLCGNQPLAIFNILFKVWSRVINENCPESRISALHAYITILESIPQEQSSDAFVCNFACKSFAHAINDSDNSKNVEIYVKSLKIIFERILINKADLIKTSVSQLLPILMIKQEEGFVKECEPLIHYLTVEMKDCLNGSEDVLDFMSSVSQGFVDDMECSTVRSFTEKLRTYKLSLVYPSYETLLNLRKCLFTNKHFIDRCLNDLNSKGFSEDCATSIIHQIINSLNDILKSTRDNKTIVETCNCLAEIGIYDLKTLVTVPPRDTHKVVSVTPTKCFVTIVVKSLSETLMDDNPTVTSRAAETLSNILKCFEDIDTIDIDKQCKQILKPLVSSSNMFPVTIKLNIHAYTDYSIEYVDGIFLRALISNWNNNSKDVNHDWLQRVTCTLLKLIKPTCPYSDTLYEVCQLKPHVCRDILAPLVGVLLFSSSTEGKIEMLGTQINAVFNYIWEQTFEDKVDSSSNSRVSSASGHGLDYGQKQMIQYMLDIVEFVRLQRAYYLRINTEVDSLNYLNLEYDKVAWAATISDQNLIAVYYGELWAFAKNGGVPPASPEKAASLEGGENMQRILRKCYVSIGDTDAVEGCGTAHLTVESEKRKYLIHTGQFADALLLHDAALSRGARADRALHAGVARSLHKSGMHHLALQYIKSLPDNDYLNEIKYECMSFLGDWSEFVDTKELDENSRNGNFNPNSILRAFQYACLRACVGEETTQIDLDRIVPLNRAKIAVATLCQNLNMETSQSVYKIVRELHIFKDIEDYYSVRSADISINDLLKRWRTENLPRFNDFKYVEALISQRVMMLEHAAGRYHDLLKDIVSLQIQYAELSLAHGRIQMSQRLIATVKDLQVPDEVTLAESEISWAKGHREIAISLLKNVVTNPTVDATTSAAALRQYGLWMAESKRENVRDIIEKYLLKSLDVMKATDHKQTRFKVYYDIAKFADAEYKQVEAYMNSSVFENKVKCLENIKDTTSSLRSTQQSLTRDEQRALIVNDRFRKLDETEIANTKAVKENFLSLAMRYYLRSLKQCELNNLCVFRVISLWLDNPSFDFEESNGEKFTDLLHAIPSRKFITVLPQLVPRLNIERTAFAENLKKIIKRCAIDHPHHTLPILFSLKNSDKDKTITLNLKPGNTQSRAQEPRVVAAQALSVELSKENESMASIMSQMERMCDAMIAFANLEPSSKEVKQAIPATERILRLGHLDAIPVPTATIPIRDDCTYSDFPALKSFDNYFELVGGINFPKKVTCLDSTGQNRILLIKGKDDLRQDAVMQQVFNIVNALLENNPVTSRIKLLIRTYKVVPLSRQSGVLEWCVGTIPLGGYLVGTKKSPGAHARYRPKDLSCMDARKKMETNRESRQSNNDKLTVFLNILRDFKPVFHYFFTEHYHNPVSWYERRLAYTKSVAASSMVGYILGLGDRHVQNILIDKHTAEVIHIDFGIAFDQGKALTTPETVPFRLTQDLVSGFGSSGVEGIFRRSCEKTMQLLRDNQETLLTILEVLLCDPLYTWIISPKQQNTRGSKVDNLNCGSSSKSGLAQRALLTVNSKLSGTEGGVAGGVAVPGQVARLIHTAMDPNNLCRLFPGWQPYL